MSRMNGSGLGPYRASSAPRAGLDPLAGVLSMGPRIPVSVLVAFTILFHAGIAGAASAAALFNEIWAWNRTVKETILFKLSQSYEVEVEKEKEKEKEPEPPPPEEKEEPKPIIKQATPPPDAPPQPPAAAEAAKVLTAEPDPNEPVDMTNTIVQGNADNYAGGQSANNGTSKKAVANMNAQPNGVPGGTGTAPAPAAPRVDRSRKASLSGSSDWTDCPFPAEADAEQIDQAFVLIQVRVKPDGNPETVTVVQDPGHGFGREARKCAMRKKYTNALDPDGNPMPAVTNPFRVRFER
jgi:periplasmic protein TonB